ncbi:TrmB family transcriptional regulator [Bailinhaonella thermotolerans]|uniref:Transcriptional regulator n=1 Tax=Bailinhaonella thermotolerans TaxID=1070861 RepID=A0A3A4BJX7_9ACTN|nr:helix-turn-helix domain-containing protein [Bailinhaonella thermotolerans]RJL35584.1 transcriptional regulator [Bailinhaonella thermotolerans]
MLQALGLTAFQERVYRTLLRFPALPVAELAAQAQGSPSRVRQALARLGELGLLRRAGRGRYVPVPPDAALYALIHRREAELNDARVAVEELAADFRAGQLLTDPAGLIEVVTGAEEIRRRTLAEHEGVREEILGLDRPPYAWPPDAYDEVRGGAAQLARGVRMRIIYSGEALAMPGRMEAVRRLAALGEQARMLPELPVKLRIYDRSKALMPLTTAERALESLAIVHPSGPLDALFALFEALWATASPITPGPAAPGGREDPHEEVIALLAAGLKDETIARHLGVSTRTARRRIAAAMDLLNAATRFQAGVNAARQDRA